MLLAHLHTRLPAENWLAGVFNSFYDHYMCLGSRTFLFVSGCVIYYSLLTRGSATLAFWQRRLSRLMGPYVVMVLLYVGLSFVFPHFSKLPSDPAAALSLIAANVSMLHGLTGATALITQTWTLSYLMVFYLAWPVVMKALQLRSIDWRTRVLGLSLVALGLRVGLGAWSEWASLFAGLVGAEVFVRRPRLGPWLQGLLLVASAALLALGEIPAALLAGCVAAESITGSGRKAFQWRPIQWAADRSYSLYLTQGLTIHAGSLVVFPFIPGVLANPAGYLFAQAGVLALGLVLANAYRERVELPAQALFRPRTPIAQPTPAGRGRLAPVSSSS